MKQPRICKTGFAAILLLLISANCMAQKASNAAGEVWKKTVGRQVDIYDTMDEQKRHLRDLSSDTTLFETIMKAVQTGKITAYSNFDHRFTEKFAFARIKQMLVHGPDTTMMVDPVTGQEVMQVIEHDIDYSVVHKYRILEEWTFNRRTGSTEIKITGIAPVQDVYVAGDFRGSRGLFWIKFNDIAGLLTQHEQYHPERTLASYIWKDYFLSDVKPGEKK